MFCNNLPMEGSACAHTFVPHSSNFVHLPQKLHMRRGGILNRGQLAFEYWGKFNLARDNTILIFTGLSPDAHAASSTSNPSTGWWEDMIGAKKAIDTEYWYVICVNSLGSCKGSTGPGSVNPITEDIYRLTFPELSIEDIADATAAALRKIGINQLACVIGCSMGGMSALSFLSRHQGISRNHINISSATHALPFAIAIRTLQREVICSDPGWNKGFYNSHVYPINGMSTARKIGMISYRSAKEWEGRFGRLPDPIKKSPAQFQFGGDFAVESYLHKHAARFINSFDPNSFLYLSQAIDRFDLGEEYGGCSKRALAEIALDNALVLGSRSDTLFPIHQQKQIADGLQQSGAAVRFIPLNCIQGHDSFLSDTKSFGEPIREFLQALKVPRLTSPKAQHLESN